MNFVLDVSSNEHGEGQTNYVVRLIAELCMINLEDMKNKFEELKLV